MMLPFKWEFPGGKIENGESETACILREIKEEINIEITIIQKLTPVIYEYGTFKISLIPFLAQYISGEIKLTEHTAYKLLKKNEFIDLDWASAESAKFAIHNNSSCRSFPGLPSASVQLMLLR